jgi:hypothetical protein
MKKIIIALALIASPAFADEPAVKMSNSGICHAEGTQYYARTKNFVEYENIDACIEAGGRLPR